MEINSICDYAIISSNTSYGLVQQVQQHLNMGYPWQPLGPVIVSVQDTEIQYYQTLVRYR